MAKEDRRERYLSYDTIFNVAANSLSLSFSFFQPFSIYLSIIARSIFFSFSVNLFLSLCVWVCVPFSLFLFSYNPVYLAHSTRNFSTFSFSPSLLMSQYFSYPLMFSIIRYLRKVCMDLPPMDSLERESIRRGLSLAAWVERERERERDSAALEGEDDEMDQQ